jgi:tetratricopeptide (TPR) repeat protein/serine/threonine protein kinase
MSESTPDVATQSGDELLLELADDYLRRSRTGEQPTVDEYVSKHPELADRIRELFPAMMAMEQHGPGATVDSAPPTERVGATIGRYKLLERIGEGGFGVVYMAEQQQPVRRKVALKVVKPGMDSRQVLARFEAERQALAIMDHPNIAKVFDAGATDSGRPYFVMELVKGEPITEFCDRNQLPSRERLELFGQVCHAVQHAHQKGIIHRDIKPTNVLVEMHDTTPVVKVIDFGVAKALGQELTDKTLFTEFAQLLGTPLYMSPEQAGQSSLDIDTRSDIYSLGVLLYELLTGTTPFDKERFKKAAHDEIFRIIREEEPPKPSTRLSESKDSLRSISAQRQTEPAKLTKLVRGELDWIVMKALEKDRTRRYETASAVARDIERYLNDEPVEACPPSAAYRLRKFARRNKTRLTMASVLGLALLMAVGSFGWVVRDRAGQRVRMANEVNQFLQRAESLYADNKLPEAVAEVEKARGVLGAGAGGGDDAVLRRVRQWLIDLDTAAKLQEVELDSQGAQDRDRVYAEFARLFRDYGIDVEALSVDAAAAQVAGSRIKLDLAHALITWALRLRSDPSPQDPAPGRRLLAIARAADADPWQLRLLDAVEAGDAQFLRDLANGADPAQLPPRTLGNLGDALGSAGDFEAAVALLREAQRQHPGDFFINCHLARFLMEEMKPSPRDEVIAFRRAALAVRPQTAWAHNDLGVVLLKPDEAIACFRRAIELDPKLAKAHYNVGVVLVEQNKLPDATAAYRMAIELDPNYADAYHNLANTLWHERKLDEAIAWYRKAIEINPKSVASHIDLGALLCDELQDYDGAAACFRKAIELDPKSALVHTNLANALRGQGKLDEAIACYRTALDLDRKFVLAYSNLGVTLSDKLQDHENAETCFRTAIELNPSNGLIHYSLGNALFHQGKLDEAIGAYHQAVRLQPDDVNTRVNLGNALARKGMLDEAIANFKEALRLKPDNADARNQLASALNSRSWTLATGPDPKKRDSGQAVELATQAVELGPQDADGWNTLGIAQYRAGNWKESIAALQKFRELRTGDVEFSNPFFLAMAHWQLGNKDEAREWFDKGAQWMDAHNANSETMVRFRKEAAELLGVNEKKENKPSSTSTQ